MPERLNTSRETLESFKKRLSPVHIVDEYPLLLEDLFLIRNPAYKFKTKYAKDVQSFINSYRKGSALETCGSWFYFPWNSTLAHYLPEEEHSEVRTARNKNIIIAEEQRTLYGLTVGYAGLSVGSHAVATFALMGGGKRIHIADPDAVSPSNLNRVRYDYLDVGRKKTDLMREYIYQLNPYSEIYVFNEGVTSENTDSFFSNIDVLVEETDHLETKIRLRLEARKRGIPVVMATDNGDNVIFECERFDLDQHTPLFNGALGDITLEEFQSFDPKELPRLATKIAGPSFVTERMMQSLPEVGKTIYSWPQLADAATLSGVVIAYALKRLALGEPLRTAKFEVNLDAIFDPTHDTRSSKREALRKDFLDALGLTS